ncbi:hypothetical protein NIES4074_43480 [Cylindrospermum sp. NIES-4074]|nr:hypothetical protein NIES4074_43480 [Cylindrospermum sp. NIES-4074]
MTDKEARIQAIQYFHVIHQSLQCIHQLACKKLLTKDNDELKESLDQLNRQILAHIVEIGLIDGHNWKDQIHTLDWSKLRESLGSRLGTIDNKDIRVAIQELLGINPSTDTENETEG